MPYSDYNTPGEFFGANYTADDTDHAIALTTNSAVLEADRLLIGLTDAQAAAADGSTAQVIYALLEMLFTKYAAIASADLPANFSIKKGGYTVSSTGALRITYTVQVEASSELVVVNE